MSNLVTELPAQRSSPGNFGTVQAAERTAARPAALNGFEDIKRRIHNRLVNQLNFEEVQSLDEDRRRRELRSIIEHLIDSDPATMGPGDRERMVQELLNDTLGLGPLEDLLRDPTVNDILVNGARDVFVERRGKLYRADVVFKDDNHLLQIIDRIVSRVGRRVDETSPMVDARLADGSRVNAIIPPLALRGPSLSIRRFGAHALQMDDLLRNRAFTPEMATLMQAAVRGRLNILISGGTGSGKTTLLNVLSSFIGPDERIVTIEDAAELQLQQAHVVQLESRPPNIEGKGAVTIRDLLRNALRMRPDRIVIGECRAGESLDMLQAMNTGHEGSLTTLHANSPRDTLARLETMIMMAGFELPIKAMRQQIASAIDLIIQTNRLQGGVRRVTSITEVAGMEGDTVTLQDIFCYRQVGVGEDGRARGRFEGTGVRPTFTARLEAAGFSLPPHLFDERVLLEA